MRRPPRQLIICDGVGEKGPYLHLIKIQLMASPVSRKTTLFVAPKDSKKLTQLRIFEYLKVKKLSFFIYNGLNFDNF